MDHRNRDAIENRVDPKTSWKAEKEVDLVAGTFFLTSAEALGINRTTLYKKMERLGLEDAPVAAR